MPTEGEEVPDFNTIFYDKEKKRIVKQTKKKVNIEGKPRMMVMDKKVVHGTKNVDVFVTSECIHLCILCIVTRCLFRDVSIMYLSHLVIPQCFDRENQ